MKVWIIIGHLIFSAAPGGDFPVHHGSMAFSSFAVCEFWRKTMSTDGVRTECKELTVFNRSRP